MRLEKGERQKNRAGKIKGKERQTWDWRQREVLKNRNSHRKTQRETQKETDS